MSIYEYNEEEHMRMEREESYAEGRKEGRANEIVRLLNKFGKTEEEVVEELVKELGISLEKARDYL